MDNVCHTLVGAALAEAGLKRRTRLAGATLMIGANFPDVDVIGIPFGHSVDFRRGWTHGVLALVVLPFVLTGIMLAWDRWVGPQPAGDPRGDATARAIPRQLLLLSTIAILTHPTLDWMNEYGMRWLMPFSGRWFYGDTLFIIDPWLWAALGVGVALVRRMGARAARIALVASGVYVIAMMGLALASRAIARERLVALGLEPASRLMVSSGFANPFKRRVLLDDGERYHYGILSLDVPSRLEIERVIETNSSLPAALQAADTPEGRRFLVWARFPFYVVEPRAEGILVRIADARYSLGRRSGDWAAVEVRLPPSDPTITEPAAAP